MWPHAVVECDVLADAALRVRNALICVQVNFLVLERFPETLDEHVVAPRTFAVHAERDAMFISNQGNEIVIGELRALVGVEYLRSSVRFDRFAYGINAEVGRQRVRKSPRQHSARCPIKNGKKIDKTLAHRDVGDVGAPYVIRLLDCKMTQ